MARPKSNKTIKSINFENAVLNALEERCRKNKINLSSFVNSVIKRAVIEEREYYRQLTKQAASDMYKYKTLMETAQ